jgi:hypothetical protein
MVSCCLRKDLDFFPRLADLSGREVVLAPFGGVVFIPKDPDLKKSTSDVLEQNHSVITVVSLNRRHMMIRTYREK